MYILLSSNESRFHGLLYAMRRQTCDLDTLIPINPVVFRPRRQRVVLVRSTEGTRVREEREEGVGVVGEELEEEKCVIKQSNKRYR